MRKLGQHNVDRIFDEALQDATMPVPGKIWAGINSELEKDQLRRKVFFYRTVAAASVLLLLGLSTWMIGFQGDGNAQWRAARKMGSQVQLPTFAQVECLEPSSEFASTPFTPTQTVKVRRKVTIVIKPNVSKAALAEMPIRVGANGGVTEVGPAIAEGRNGAEVIRQTLSSRLPEIANPIADRGLRPVNAFAVPKASVASEVFASITPQKKKEKEFSFAAYESEKEAKPEGKWELGAGFAPDMAFASTTPLGQGSRSSRGLADDPAQAKTNRLSPVVAYAAVLRASYDLGERFSIRAGVSCVNRQSSTFASVNTFGKNATSYQSNLNLYSLEVPVSLKYNVIHAKNYDYYVTTGVSGNFFLHYDNYLQTSEGNIAGRRSSSTSEILKPSQASLLMSTGLRYRLHERLSMQLEPGIRYGVVRNEYAFSQRRPVSTSLLSGLSYHF
ncbi:MAG: outer membrane protein beta-barrel domain [Bacteroidota bacterium]|jgi:hypothetical protein